jgi:PadR family transcriptional regulator PadR
MADKTCGEMIRGNLDLLVLSTLSNGPKYGYLIQQDLAATTGGLMNVQAGTLYPMLHQLEAERLIRSRWDETTGRKRKWYELTPAGQKRLQHQAHLWREYAECVWRLLSPLCGGVGNPVGNVQ